MDGNFENGDSFDFPRPIVVAGAVSLWAKVLVWLLRALFVYIVYYWLSKPPNIDKDFHFAVILFGIPWFCAEAALLVLLLKRRWLLATEDGFTYSSLFGSETFTYDDIEGTSLQVKELPSETHFLFFGKAPARISRDFRIWLRGRLKPIRFRFTTRADKPDPLYGFIMVVLGKLAHDFQQKLESGGSIDGDGWAFADSSFRFSDETGSPVRLAIEDIGAAETIGDRFHVWRRSESESCFSVPIHGKNVGWLSAFLDDSITPEERQLDGLGRFLFEIKRMSTFAYLVFGAILLGGMILLPSLVPVDGDNGGTVIIAEIIAGLFLVALPFIWGFTYGKRFYENGFVLTGIFSEKEIPFDDVETFEWGRTDNYHNGAYVGSMFTFMLHLRPETGMRKFNLNHSNRKGDEGNHGVVRQKLTEHLGRRMGEKLTAEKHVEWVKDVELTETSVVFAQKKWRKVEVVELPYDQIEIFGMLDNTAFPTFGIIHKDGQQGIQLGTGHKNFFPGLFLFGEIMKNHLAPVEEAGAAEGA